MISYSEPCAHIPGKPFDCYRVTSWEYDPLTMERKVTSSGEDHHLVTFAFTEKAELMAHVIDVLISGKAIEITPCTWTRVDDTPEVYRARLLAQLSGMMTSFLAFLHLS